jgi:hypothetical protein
MRTNGDRADYASGKANRDLRQSWRRTGVSRKLSISICHIDAGGHGHDSRMATAGRGPAVAKSAY